MRVQKNMYLQQKFQKRKKPKTRESIIQIKLSNSFFQFTYIYQAFILHNENNRDTTNLESYLYITRKICNLLV